MQRVQDATQRWSLRIIDSVIILGTFVLNAWVRETLRDYWTIDILPGPQLLHEVNLQNQLHLIVLILPVWLFSLHVGGAYNDLRRLRSEIGRAHV